MNDSRQRHNEDAMPVFEYRCAKCSKRFSLLVGVVAGDDRPICPACGSSEAAKIVSRFQRGRTEDERIDEAAERLRDLGDADDAAALEPMAKELGKALDDDLSGEIEHAFHEDMGSSQ